MGAIQNSINQGIMTGAAVEALVNKPLKEQKKEVERLENLSGYQKELVKSLGHREQDGNPVMTEAEFKDAKPVLDKYIDTQEQLYTKTGDPKYLEEWKETVESKRAFNETDLPRALQYNKRAEDILQTKRILKNKIIEKKQSYLDEPLSIGGKEIGTVRGLPKDLRSQVKEGMKNVR